MAFTYNDDLSDTISRIRLAVGDTASPGLLPDATYTTQLRLTASGIRRAETAAAGDLIYLLSDSPQSMLDSGIVPRSSASSAALGWVDGDEIIVTRALASCGLTVGEVYYAAEADPLGGSLQLATSIGGAAVNITADTTIHLGRLDEAAATRAIAAALAAKYAQKPTQITDSGSGLTWGERIAQWNRIALGQAGKRATVGVGALRRSAADYTLEP